MPSKKVNPLDRVVFIQKVTLFACTTPKKPIRFCYVNKSWNDAITNYSMHQLFKAFITFPDALVKSLSSKLQVHAPENLKSNTKLVNAASALAALKGLLLFKHPWHYHSVRKMSKIFNTFMPRYLHGGDRHQESQRIFLSLLDVVDFLKNSPWSEENNLNHVLRIAILDFWSIHLNSAANSRFHDAFFVIDKKFPFPFVYEQKMIEKLSRDTIHGLQTRIISIVRNAATAGNLKLIDHFLDKEPRFAPYMKRTATARGTAATLRDYCRSLVKQIAFSSNLANSDPQIPISLLKHFYGNLQYVTNKTLDQHLIAEIGSRSEVIRDAVVPAIMNDNVELLKYLIEDKGFGFHFNPFLHQLNLDHIPKYCRDVRCQQAPYHARTALLLACEYGAIKTLKFLLNLATKKYEDMVAVKKTKGVVLAEFGNTPASYSCRLFFLNDATSAASRYSRSDRVVQRLDSPFHYLAKLAVLRTNPHASLYLFRRDRNKREEEGYPDAEKYFDQLAAKMVVRIVDFYCDYPTMAQEVFGGKTLRDLVEHENVVRKTAEYCAKKRKRTEVWDVLLKLKTKRGIQSLVK